MPIESNRPIKKCKYCTKEVQNLATHIINSHPSILEQLEEGEIKTPPETPPKALNTPQNATIISEDTETLIRRKLNTLMDIQIIKALGSGAELKDIRALVTPQKTPQEVITETIALHNAIYPKGNNTVVESGSSVNQWLELANNALPIIRDMLPKKQSMEVKQNDGYKEPTRGDRKPIRTISQQIAEHRGESGSISKESGIDVRAEQQNSREPEIINKGN
jgi:hypothetical protein